MSSLPKVEFLKVDGSTPSLLEKFKAFRFGAQQVPRPPWWLIVLFFVAAIAIAVTTIQKLQTKVATPENARSTLDIQRQALQVSMPFFFKNRQDARSLLRSVPKALGDPIAENESSFINFMPLTCQDTGYLGPLENGVFAEAEAVNLALRAGARCFVLNIDYHEDQTLPIDLFGRPKEPRLIYRDAGGVIKCINTGEIRNVAQALANTAFSNIINNPNDPLIVVLFFQREPKGSVNDKLAYYSKVAEQLEALIPYHLGQTPQGDYHRQQRQDDLPYQPITAFEKKVLFFSNVKTAEFRTQNFPPTKDLDYLVHLILFKESTDTYGATAQVDSRGVARGIVNSVTNFLIIPQNKYKDTSDSTKLRWTMAYVPAAMSPSVASFEFVSKTLGVQSVPLWLFATKEPSSSALKELRDKAKENTPQVEVPKVASEVASATAASATSAASAAGNTTTTTSLPSAPSPDDKPKEEDFPKIMANWLFSSYIPKPKQIRFIRPAPYTPGTPSPRMDANGGNLTTPTL